MGNKIPTSTIFAAEGHMSVQHHLSCSHQKRRPGAVESLLSEEGTHRVKCVHLRVRGKN